MTKLYAKIKGAHAISLFDFPKTWQVCCGHWVCNTHWWNCSVILCLIALAFPEDGCDCISLQGLQRSLMTSCISSAGVVQSGQQVLLALYCFLRELWSRYGSYSPLCSFSKLCNFQCDIKSHIYVFWMQIMELMTTDWVLSANQLSIQWMTFPRILVNLPGSAAHLQGLKTDHLQTQGAVFYKIFLLWSHARRDREYCWFIIVHDAAGNYLIICSISQLHWDL